MVNQKLERKKRKYSPIIELIVTNSEHGITNWRRDPYRTLVDVHYIQFRHERISQMGLKLTPLGAVTSEQDSLNDPSSGCVGMLIF